MRAWGVVGLLVLSGCDDVIFGSAELDTEPIEIEGWAGVQTLFQQQCLDCHSAASVLGGLDLETDPHANIVGVVGGYGLPIINANDPSTSILYLKITSTQPMNTGTDMPPGSGGVDLGIATIVENWILDGAPAE